MVSCFGQGSGQLREAQCWGERRMGAVKTKVAHERLSKRRERWDTVLTLARIFNVYDGSYKACVRPSASDGTEWGVEKEVLG
jgi:hypothetical protein